MGGTGVLWTIGFSHHGVLSEPVLRNRGLLGMHGGAPRSAPRAGLGPGAPGF